MDFEYLSNIANQRITNQIITDLIDEHKTVKLPRYRTLMQYYKAEHEILNRQQADTTKPNNRLVNDYPGYIVDTIQGYFIGIPIQYSTEKNEKYLTDLKDVFDSNNETDHNAEIAKYMGILGEAYELLYVNENSEVRFSRLKNEETIVVLDSTFQRSVQMALRYYDMWDINVEANTRKKLTKVELYYDDRVEYYIQDGNNYILEDTKPHYFGKVPVIYYINNDERIGDYEKVLTLVDDYDKRISDNSNELEAFRNSYLKLKNLSGTTDEDLADCKKTGAFKVEGDGDVSFIEKDINDAYTEHHMERLDKNIHKFSKVPCLTDESFAGNLSGVAIKYKLWPIEQVAACKERKFKTGLMRRIKLITEIFKKQGKNYDWKDISIKFKRNIPANVLELSQITANIKGIVSDETLLSILPFIEDPADELEKIKAEQEDSLNYTDLSKTYNASNKSVSK
jgi:SPP1 family phage portal protein